MVLVRLIKVAVVTTGVIALGGCTAAGSDVPSPSNGTSLPDSGTSLATNATGAASNTPVSASSAQTAPPGAELSIDDLRSLARTRETRACGADELSYVAGDTPFCKVDVGDFKAGKAGDTLYVTVAVPFVHGAKYSAEASMGSKTAHNSFESPSGEGVEPGYPMALHVKLSVPSSGTMNVKFFQDGAEIASKTVHVSMV